MGTEGPRLRHPAEDASSTGVEQRSTPVACALGWVLSTAMLLAGVGYLTGRQLAPDIFASSEPGHVAAEVPVTAMDQGVAPANNSPVLLADPTDERFVVLANRLDAPDFGCALQLSGDGGRRWEPALPVPELPEGAEKCYAPEVAFDRDGVLYYLFVGLAGAGNEPMGAFLTSSADRGRTFAPPRQVLGPTNFSVRMAIDPSMGETGRIHLAWLHARSDPPLGGFGPPPNPILTAHSDDGGSSFSEPVQVSDDTRQRVVAPALALGPDHRVHVAYYDLGRDAVDYQGLEGPVWSDTWSLVLASSNDGGLQFEPGQLVDDAIVPFERVMLIFTMPPPSLVADEDRVCVAWADAREGDPDALVRCSESDGGEWDEARRVNDDPPGNGAWQYLPRLALGPEGRLDAAFYDRRDTVENLATFVYSTFSEDGGRTFAPNVRVSGEATDPRIGQAYGVPSAQGQIEFGSRLGVLSRPADTLLAWPDTRNSKPLSTGQDIFSAVVELPARTRPWWTSVLGVALVSGGLLLGWRLVPRGRRRGDRSET